MRCLNRACTSNSSGPSAGRTLVLLALVGLVGCGSDHEKKTASVSGTVTFEGRAMPGGGQIRFVPLAKDQGKAAAGTIDAEGKFTLSTYGDEDGAVIGEHRVEVTQNAVLKPAVYEEVKTAEGTEEKLVQAEVPLPAGDRIPQTYAGNKSPLRFTVEDGSNAPEIKLKKDGS